MFVEALHDLHRDGVHQNHQAVAAVGQQALPPPGDRAAVVGVARARQGAIVDGR